ncbi:MAG TPA: hypothetical protein VGF16_02595 [Bryobacteraceae bacterium]
MLPTSSLNQTGGNDPAKAKDAAQQFEALLLGQILRSVREAAGSENGDEAASCATEFAEQQFALVLARQGGLGLAALIARGLERKPATSEPPAADGKAVL